MRNGVDKLWLGHHSSSRSVLQAVHPIISVPCANLYRKMLGDAWQAQTVPYRATGSACRHVRLQALRHLHARGRQPRAHAVKLRVLGEGIARAAHKQQRLRQRAQRRVPQLRLRLTAAR